MVDAEGRSTLNDAEVLINITVVPEDAESCAEKYKSTELSGVTCSSEWDNFYCWPPTLGGELIAIPCEHIFPFFEDYYTQQNQQYAYRVCGTDGRWLWGNWTNYTECMDFQQQESISPLTVSYIIFIGSIISLLCLVASLFIFFYFKSLQCSRIRVHRNLVTSLILHSIVMLIVSLPGIFDCVVESFQSSDWFCKVILTLKMYSAMTCIYWMFVEGHLLHSSITVSVFGNETPFYVYYAVGWGIPFLFVMAWVTTMSVTYDVKCWKGYGTSPFIWLVTGPMILALLVNSVFLVNIIRILITKLKMSQNLEIKQVKKAIKATALLFPLLGITHLLFCINPRDDAHLEHAYMITNAVLQSSQGLFVATLYCFFNSEVQAVLANAYLRFSMKRHPERSYAQRSRVLGSVTNTTSLSQGYEHVNGTSSNRAKTAKRALPMATTDFSEQEDRTLFERETSFIS